MKIICSSLVLENAIEKALKKKLNSIQKVKVTRRQILFGNIEVIIDSNLTGSYEDIFDFIPLKWYKIMMFLKQIPEQPITLSIYEDRIDIYCVAVF